MGNGASNHTSLQKKYVFDASKTIFFKKTAIVVHIKKLAGGNLSALTSKRKEIRKEDNEKKKHKMGISHHLHDDFIRSECTTTRSGTGT